MTNVFSSQYRALLELHDAAKRGEVERVQRLLSTGSLNINCTTAIVSIPFTTLVDTIYIKSFAVDRERHHFLPIEQYAQRPTLSLRIPTGRRMCQFSMHNNRLAP